MKLSTQFGVTALLLLSVACSQEQTQTAAHPWLSVVSAPGWH